MRFSSSRLKYVWLIAATAAAVMLWIPTRNAPHAAGEPVGAAARAPVDLLINGGFEQHDGLGTIPHGWEAVDEHFGFFRWIAPRVERRIGSVGPRSGRFFVGLDTEKLGVDTNDKDDPICRAALYQTIEVPGRCRGEFSLYYNDLGSSALSHVSAIRLAYTINSTEVSEIRYPFRAHADPPAGGGVPAVWSPPWYRVSQTLPDTHTALGDWSPASIPVSVDAGDQPVRLTLWIGIFDHQHSTELGTYRVDDARFVLFP